MSIKQGILYTTLFLGLWCVNIIVACSFGSYPVEFDAVRKALTVLFLHGFSPAIQLMETAGISSVDFTVVVDLRLPRILLSLFVGGGLALAGVVFQNVLRNPLADPYTLGVSGGAALGASIVISGAISGVAVSLTSLTGVTGATGITGAMGLDALLGQAQLVPLAAFVGAICALLLALGMGALVGEGFQRESIILSGVMVSTLLTALVALVKAFNEESVTSIVFWIMGSFQGRVFSHLILLLPWFIVGILCIIPRWRDLDILALGDIQAQQLGMHVSRARFQLLFGASVITAASVAVVGIIGFIGLVVPHLLRTLVGDKSVNLLPCAWIAGGILLLWADVFARTVLTGGAELPVGVVTALFGVPFFCFLLLRQKRRARQ